MTTKTEKIEEKVPTKLERATKIKDELMKEGVHYGKIQGATSDFLWLSGASLLADEFEIDGVMSDVSEVQVDGQSQITVTIDMLDRNTADRHCVGVGTWDSGEMLGNRQGARQRGIAMAYKRAYVLGIRYATNSFGIFTQDEDIIKQDEKEEKRNPNNDSTGNEFSDGPQTFFQFDPANNDWIFIKGKLKSQNGNKVWTLTETKEQEPGYLRWILENVSDLIAEDREKIVEALES